MQHVVNFTSMQCMSISVDTGAEGTLSTIVHLWRQAWVSTIVAGGAKRVNNKG